MKKIQTDKKTKGFTLIELMVTISIIAILATVGAVVYSGVQKNARISKRVQDLEAIKVALESYKASTGKYPTVSSAGCIENLLVPLVPTYMQVIPKDPSETGCNGGSYRYVTDFNVVLLGKQYKVHTTSTDMTDADYRAQPNLIDPKRDGGADDCKVDPPAVGTGNVTAWAIYSFTSSTPNTCTLYNE